ncbi:MAG: 1-acyl-sn-glycerol-3-phosphate acyltransferase [Planctomycetaceae bacterium]|nr:1-acyl-sn-glycerol-3-phosphate acyltransferase [Planctomycetaceae bacterium]
MKILKFLQYIWYFICGWPCRFFCMLFFKIRFFGVENVPKRGGFILLCNHQSWLDPMFVVVPVNRRSVFAARDNLFRIPFVGFVFRVYNCIPIKRNHADIGAIRECIEKLKQNCGLVLFPEGTRTRDGKIAHLKPGFTLLAKKANVPIIPVVIDGAFECWPRTQGFPALDGKICIQYGEPIDPEKIAPESDREFMSELTEKMRQMQTELRLKVGRKPFVYNQEEAAKSPVVETAPAVQTPKSFIETMKRKINFYWYCLWRQGCRIVCRLYFNPTAFNKHYVPDEGAFLLLSNHQSFLDPMINADPLKRQCCFAARDTLFTSPVFGKLVHSFNAIPIKRGQADLTAIRAFIEKLNKGYGLVLYPEGTRTEDGKIAEMKPGFGLLARKANVPIIPSVIDGAYEAWPRHRKYFSYGKVYVTYGEPIPASKVAEMGDREFAHYLTQVLREMQKELRLMVGRKPFDYGNDS